MSENYRKWRIIVFIVFMAVLIITYFKIGVDTEKVTKKEVSTILTTESHESIMKAQLENYQNIWKEKTLMKEKPAVDVSGTWKSDMPNGKTGRMVFQQEGYKVTGVFRIEGKDKGLDFSGTISGKDLVGAVKGPFDHEIGKIIIHIEGDEMGGVQFKLDPPAVINWEATRLK